MKNAPYLAKEKIFHELHPAFLPRPKLNKKPAAKTPRAGRRRAPLTAQGARRQHRVSFAPVAQLDRASAFEAEG